MTVANLYGLLWDAHENTFFRLITATHKQGFRLHQIKGLGETSVIARGHEPLNGFGFHLDRPMPLEDDIPEEILPQMEISTLLTALDTIETRIPLNYSVLAHHKKALFIPIGIIKTPLAVALVCVESPESLLLRGALLHLDGTWSITPENLSTL